MVQVNTRHSEVVWTLLEKVVRERRIELVAVQEPPLSALRDEGKWEGFDFLFSRGSPPQVALIINSKIKFSPLQLAGSRVCGASVNCQGFSIAFISSYLRHSTGEGHEELSLAIEASRDLCSATILCADCNGHSPLWGPSSVALNTVGQLMENIIVQERLLVLNHSDSPPTFRGDNGQVSWIDITAVTPNLLSRVVSWSVDESMEVGSDHIPIHIVLSFAPQRGEVRNTPNWKMTDWRSFNVALLARLGHPPLMMPQTPEEVDQMVAHLTESLQGTIHECVPVKRICFYSRKGWTPQATVLHKLMIDRRRRWTRFQRISDRERYLQARSHFRHCLAKGRRAAWRELCSSTSSANFWTLYKKATRERGSRNVEELHFQQQIATTDLEKATMLSRVFFPPLPPADPSHHDEVTDFSWSTHRPPGLPESELVSTAELVRVIRRLRVATAPGLDGISVLCLRKCMMTLLPWILSLCNASLTLAYFPKAWRRAKVIALRKPGKDAYDTPEPIGPSAFFRVWGKFWKR